MENHRRVTKEQKTVLIEYMEANKDFAQDKLVNYNGPKTSIEQWKMVALRLNALGGAVKTAEGWKRAWINMRSKTKQKSLDIISYMEKNGGNGLVMGQLTDLDKRIIDVMKDVNSVGQEEFEEPYRISSPTTNTDSFLVKEEHTPDELFSVKDEIISEVSFETSTPPPSFLFDNPDQIRNLELQTTNEAFIKVEEKKLKILEKRNEIEEERNKIEKEKVAAIKDLTNAIQSIAANFKF